MITAMFLLVAQMSCPMHAEHVNARHDTLGMAHDKTTHSFRLFADGGAIELRANDSADNASVDAIRKHLRDIASQFRRNDFSTPMFVHDRMPDGVDDLKRLRRAIDYRYQDLPEGGRVRITTRDPAALAALHEFLKFQIDDHHTSDSKQLMLDKESGDSR